MNTKIMSRPLASIPFAATYADFPAHSGQPWHSRSLGELQRYFDRYWAWLRRDDLTYRQRFQFDRWCSEIVEEIGLRMTVRAEAGR